MIKSYIKNILPREKWNSLSALKRNVESMFKKPTLNIDLKYKTKILIIGVADYENLGDHAIGYAQRLFLDSVSIDTQKYEIIEVPLNIPVNHISQIINPNDIILITGGGNLGTKYEFLNDLYLPIIKKFPKNKKLFFPQSYTFDAKYDTPKSMEKIKHIFSKSANNLTITARESKSYKLFKDTFPDNNVILTPDIVLSLDQNENKDKTNKSDIIILMRSDSEKTLDEDIEKQIINKLSSKYKVTIDDTVVPDLISHEDRLYNLNETWTKIKENKLVITDRLHGMIFAQITGTPCIVFDNYNNKIKMTCEDWLSDMDHIRFVNPNEIKDSTDFVEIASELMSQSTRKFNTSEKYEPLRKKLNEIIN